MGEVKLVKSEVQNQPKGVQNQPKGGPKVTPNWCQKQNRKWSIFGPKWPFYPPKMGQNGPFWGQKYKSAKNPQNGPKMAKNGPKWTIFGQNGNNPKMAKNGPKWGQNGSKSMISKKVPKSIKKWQKRCFFVAPKKHPKTKPVQSMEGLFWSCVFLNGRILTLSILWTGKCPSPLFGRQKKPRSPHGANFRFLTKFWKTCFLLNFTFHFPVPHMEGTSHKIQVLMLFLMLLALLCMHNKALIFDPFWAHFGPKMAIFGHFWLISQNRPKSAQNGPKSAKIALFGVLGEKCRSGQNGPIFTHFWPFSRVLLECQNDPILAHFGTKMGQKGPQKTFKTCTKVFRKSRSFYVAPLGDQPKMAQNGPKWAKITPFWTDFQGPKWPILGPRLTMKMPPKNPHFGVFSTLQTDPPKSAKKCQKWPKMAIFDSFPTLAKNGQKWPKMTKNGPKMTKNGQNWTKIGDSENPPKMAKNGQKWPKSIKAQKQKISILWT